MSDAIPQPAARPPIRTFWFWTGALLVVALVLGVVIWLAIRDTNGSSASPGKHSAVSARQIATLARRVGHPIFWIGPHAGFTYELTRQPNGTILVRYLPVGARIGSRTPYLTVATYPFPNALSAIQSAARSRGVSSFDVAGGGLAEVASSYSQSVHVAYPDLNYQVELYDPSPGSAVALAKTGGLVAVRGTRPGRSPTAPVAASLADLKALPASLGRPVYWVGPRKGLTYEVRQTADGQIILRYLPTGVAPGSPKAYLSVGTYPFARAFEAIQGLARKHGAETIELPGGGLAVIDPGYPSSIHLAYPRSNYQVEVYDPTPGAARRLVASGRVGSFG